MIFLPRLLFLFLPMAVLQAGTALEFDFRNFDETTRTVRATAHRPETSPFLQAAGEAIAVEPERATGIPGAGAPLATGSVLIGAQTKQGGFLQSRTDGPDGASYGDYAGTAGFGRGTIAMVFQPTFSAAAGKGERKACLFATNFRGTAAEGLLFLIEEKLTLVFGLGKAASPGQKVSLAPPDWDSSKWYFLAASWAPDEKPAIFWKELGAKDHQFATGPEALIDPRRRIAKAVRLGNSGNQDANLGGDAPLNGRLAYFLWLDEYLSDSQTFERLCDRVVSGQKAD